MNRLKVLFAVLLLVALGILVSRLEVRQEVEHQPPGAAVKSNPFLAASRLLARRDIQSRHFPVGRHLHIPERDTLLVMDQTRARLDAETSTALRDWVAGGGHLVMAVRGQDHDSAAEWRQRLPLLSDLGVRMKSVDEGWDSAVEDPFVDQLEQAGEMFMRLCSGAGGDFAEMCENALCKRRAWPSDTRIKLPGHQRTWHIELDTGWRLAAGATAEGAPPVVTRLSGGNELGDQLLMLDVGKGRLTLLTSMTLWHNERLHWLDHAALLAHLAEGQTAVWFTSAISVPPLHLWLWQRAWPLILALLSLLALFIARHLSRCGPVLQPAPEASLDFSRHLLAAGQLLARRGNHTELLAPLRRDVLNRLARHGIAARQAARWCARHTPLSREAIDHALRGSPADRRQLVNMVNTLQQLRTQL